MNKLQITELLQKHHPHLTSTQIELYLEESANLIAEETLITKRTWLLNSVAGKRWYDLDVNVIRIDKVSFNDVVIPKLIGDLIIDDDEFVDPVDGHDTALATPTANVENKRFWMVW